MYRWVAQQGEPSERGAVLPCRGDARALQLLFVIANECVRRARMSRFEASIEGREVTNMTKTGNREECFCVGIYRGSG